MNAPVIYIPNFVSLSASSIDSCIAWEQRETARAEAFMSADGGIAYTYGKPGFERTYVSTKAPKEVRALMDLVNAHVGNILGVCFANRYATAHNHVGWHKDDSADIDQSLPIAVISIGAEREIWFRNNASNEVEKLVLGHGSLAIMEAGMQSTHQHRIPKHTAECGVRVSLTMRAMR